MSRIFGYGRVSTDEQTTEQQLMVIKNAGYEVLDNRWITDEGVSGGVSAMQRPAFKNLIENKLEAGDTLVISKLDRLGRDNIDVQQVVDILIKAEIKVIILDLPCPDLSSSQGKLMLQMFAAFAEFEKARIGERTREALAKKKQAGEPLGRPVLQVADMIQQMKATGMSQGKVLKAFADDPDLPTISLSTIKRNWNLK